MLFAPCGVGFEHIRLVCREPGVACAQMASFTFWWGAGAPHSPARCLTNSHLALAHMLYVNCFLLFEASHKAGQRQGCGAVGSMSEWEDLQRKCGCFIPLPGIYPQRAMIWKAAWTPMCTAVLFTTDKAWKQPKCLSTKEPITELRCVHTMECSFSVCLVAKLCLTPLWPLGLEPTRLLCPWDFPGKNTGVGCRFLL